MHGKALAAGLTAMKEAEDFLAGGARLETDLDLAAIIEGHSTPALKNRDIDSLTSLVALKSYFTFAQEKLAQAAGNEVAGSMTLRALGKLHEELARGKEPGTKAAASKAVAFYQASLMVCPQNFMAANDLGVMFARNGNYDDARKLLEYSLSLNMQSTVCNNLAMVYGHMQLNDKARQAQQQALAAAQMEQKHMQNSSGATGGRVNWVDENTFAQAYDNSGARQGVSFSPRAVGNMSPQQNGLGFQAGQGTMQPASNRHGPAIAGANSAGANNAIAVGPLNAVGSDNAGNSANHAIQPMNRPLPMLHPASADRISKTPGNEQR
jgi:tetratricopeptide (TPR) repeat protein